MLRSETRVSVKKRGAHNKDYFLTAKILSLEVFKVFWCSKAFPVAYFSDITAKHIILLPIFSEVLNNSNVIHFKIHHNYYIPATKKIV